MECTKCGTALIYDSIDGTEEGTLVWCPFCGKDFTQEYHDNRQDNKTTLLSRIKGIFGCHEVPRTS